MTKIKVNRPGQWCAGLGDMVTWCWIAAGSTEPLSFVATGANADLLNRFGQTVTTDESDAIDPTPCYRRELDERGVNPRCETWAEAISIQTVPTRPTWRSAQREPRHPRRIVLCPQSHFKSRTWPVDYWLDLNWGLIAAGYEVIFAIESDTGEFSQRGPSVAVWGYGFGQLADLYRSAGLVIGNDSFPAHFAGTLGAKVLVIAGPTKATCFSHIQNVTVATADPEAVPCVGCHFSRPYRDVCDRSCQALNSLLPHHITKWISDNASME